MAYGCVIGKGKSSTDYNYSAPHGAGRIMSRTDAVHKVDLDVYQKAMKGVKLTNNLSVKRGYFKLFLYTFKLLS